MHNGAFLLVSGKKMQWKITSCLRVTLHHCPSLACDVRAVLPVFFLTLHLTLDWLSKDKQISFQVNAICPE